MARERGRREEGRGDWLGNGREKGREKNTHRLRTPLGRECVSSNSTWFALRAPALFFQHLNRAEYGCAGEGWSEGKGEVKG